MTSDADEARVCGDHVGGSPEACHVGRVPVSVQLSCANTQPVLSCDAQLHMPAGCRLFFCLVCNLHINTLELAAIVTAQQCSPQKCLDLSA